MFEGDINVVREILVKRREWYLRSVGTESDFYSDFMAHEISKSLLELDKSVYKARTLAKRNIRKYQKHIDSQPDNFCKQHRRAIAAQAEWGFILSLLCKIEDGSF